MIFRENSSQVHLKAMKSDKSGMTWSVVAVQETPLLKVRGQQKIPMKWLLFFYRVSMPIASQPCKRPVGEALLVRVSDVEKMWDSRPLCRQHECFIARHRERPRAIRHSNSGARSKLFNVVERAHLSWHWPWLTRILMEDTQCG